MLVQQNFPTRDNQISQPDAAAQHRFPKAAIELVQIGRNPNRSYAAPVTDVSHADEAAFRVTKASRSCLPSEPNTSAEHINILKLKGGTIDAVFSVGRIKLGLVDLDVLHHGQPPGP
jgi:hypothetical protein